MSKSAPHAALSRFSRSLLLTVGVFAAFVAVFALYVYEEKRIDSANDQRHLSLQLAAELRQSSDDLTRMVRTYVTTGDPVYKRHYQEILDIRDGRKPRPLHYEDVYWDLVMADDARPRGDGIAVPLLDSMKKAGFTDAEFAKLAQAKANSDTLTQPEFAAMALIESTSPPSEANRLKATEMLYDAAYHQAKAGIMRPIGEFSQMIDQRTLTAVIDAENVALAVRFALIAIGLLLIAMLWRVYLALHSILGGSVEGLYESIVRLGGGDLSTPIAVPQGMENSVIGWLALTQANLSRIESERKHAEETVRQLAFYDHLTELPNRRLFNDRMKRAMLASKRNGTFGAIMFLDLDNFKPLNDTYGHDVGDLLLIEVAQRLKGCVREMDTVARFGGDEFVVMLVDLSGDRQQSMAKAQAVAEKIRAVLADPYQLTIPGGTSNVVVEHQCGASIGVTLFIREDPSEDDILKRADDAMYQAKKAGRNLVQISS